MADSAYAVQLGGSNLLFGVTAVRDAPDNVADNTELLCRFFTFMLLLFLLHSMGLGMFRVIASLCRDETISSTGGAFFFLVLLLLGGFLLPRRALLQATHGIGFPASTGQY